jgi:poly(3-hydroxybutyrate) depolymerase
MRRWLASVVVIMAMVGGALALPSSASPTDNRPYGLQVPSGYDARRPAPLVVLLHSYTSNGQAQADYFGLSPLADKAGFLLATPDGTRDIMGDRFWNATDACCDWFHSRVDDVAYIDAVIDEIAARHSVDPARVFLVGHSNGAFMSHRYACERADRVAAIVTLAGMQWKDQSQCRPSSPVSVLQVHGRDDGNIEYGRTTTGATGRWPPPAGGSTSTGASPTTRPTRRPTAAARPEPTSSCGPSNGARTPRPSTTTGPPRSGPSWPSTPRSSCRRRMQPAA